jgi:biopolymer transport protein ExbD
MNLEPSGRAKEASFDLTPMIDVVLLLIIFFSMTSQFTETQYRPMDLPREPGQKSVEEDASMSIVLDLDRDGAVSVLGRQLDGAELAQSIATQVKAAAGASGPLEVVVRADRRAASRDLERVGRALADAGITQWKIATTGTAGTAGGAGVAR